MFKASDVKELREKTGAGMLDCKKALEENNGDMEKSIDWLREKGIAKAAKKERRAPKPRQERAPKAEVAQEVPVETKEEVVAAEVKNEE